jgi:hypothetical protein
VLDGVKAGAFGKHPAGKDSLHLAGKLHLVDLDEGCSMGLLSRRARIANPRRHFEGAEFDRLVDRNLEMGDAARDLVEGREDSDRVFEDVGRERARSEASRQRQGK